MAGKNLPTEGKIYVQQLDKQINHVYNPTTDGKIYNPATDGPAIYRNNRGTEPKNALPLQEQINKYTKLKTLQATIFIVGFLVGFFCLYLGSVVETHYIHAHILTWFFLFRGVSSTIATVLLYRGNKKEDPKLLKAFLTVGCLSYSWFDYYAGGYCVVRGRMMEIGSKQAGIPVTNSHHSNAVPVV